MLIRSLFAALLLSLALPACAQQSDANLTERYLEGTHFFRLDPGAPRIGSGTGVEVVEVFTYGCVWCAHLQPIVDNWKAAGGASNADWVYLPATFNPAWEMLARVYYAVETMDVLPQVHQPLFDHIHKQGQQIRSLEDAATFLATLGISREDFLGTARSFAVDAKLNRAKSLLPAFRVQGTPTVIVAGRWVVTGQSAGAYENVPDVVAFLVARELASRPGA